LEPDFDVRSGADNLDNPRLVSEDGLTDKVEKLRLHGTFIREDVGSWVFILGCTSTEGVHIDRGRCDVPEAIQEHKTERQSNKHGNKNVKSW